MELTRTRRNRQGWILAGLCIVLIPGIVSAQVVKTEVVKYYDYTMPYWWGTDDLTAIQTFRDINLTANDIAKILPLIADLRFAEQQYNGNMAIVYNDTLVRSNKTDTPSVYTPDQAWQHYRTRRDKIWSTISARIGADKANALRGLCEAQSHTVQPVLSDRLQRIDTLIAQWDTQAKARIAAYGQNPPITVTETTTVTEQPGLAHVSPATETITYYTTAPLTNAELYNILQNRFVVLVYGPDALNYFWFTEHEVTPAELWRTTFMRYGIWK